MPTSDPPSMRSWLGLSQADRDAAYNNRGAIGNAEELILARREASNEVRARFRCHLDVPYGVHPRERWDIFPGRDPNAPCLVFIHGGYWQGGDKTDFSACVRGALEKGWSAALCGYPLAPESSLTQIVDRIVSALVWFDDHRAGYEAGGPLVLSGWSAGAHLAAISARHDAVQAVLCISGIFDLAPLRDTFLNAKLNLSDQEIARFSPIRLEPIEKPFIVAFGADELPELQRQSREFFRVRQDAGVPGSLTVLPGANHLTVLEELGRARSVLTEATQVALSIAARS